MNKLRALWQRIFNRYEAASHNYEERSYLPAAIQDARFDANASTRIELVRRSRYWERNNAIVNKLADLFEQFTVGANGLQCVPNSKDEVWNQAASQWFDQWSAVCDLTTRQPFAVLQSLIARSWFIDGEVFIHKVFSPREPRRPRLQLIEGHRVSTPPKRAKDEGNTIVDGVEIDEDGRPTGYWVSQRSKTNPSDLVFTKLDAESVIHVFEPARPGQYRGLPFLYPVMNTLHDLDDLLLMEKKKAKAVAEVSYFIRNASGEVASFDKWRSKVNLPTITSSNTAGTKEQSKYYQETFGGRVAVGKKGEEVQQFASESPSAATQWLYDYLTGLICAGTGISKLLVLPYSNQGTVVRADLDVSTAFFRARSSVISAAVKEIYRWTMEWAVRFDRSLDGGPRDSWANVTVRPPRAPNVDVGRNSAALIAEYKAGLRTAESIFGELGADWREALTQRAEEAAFIRDLAARYGVAPEVIATQSDAPAPKPESEPEKKEEPNAEEVA